MKYPFRQYQKEADLAITQALETDDKCLIKMFCGSGKSVIMRYMKAVQKKPLVVYVFPSLALIEQFVNDYLHDFPAPCILKISSECTSTTDPILIRAFLSSSKKPKTNKIICITYQSFGTLTAVLEKKIDVCVYDEAHHAIGQTYQKLIFDPSFCHKQIFFTATPQNGNGVTMILPDDPPLQDDPLQLQQGMCGKLCFEYTYFQGVQEGYLNPFEIRVDLSCENSNKEIFRCIARSVLTTGNNRVLTFHADVNGDRDTSVLQFVDLPAFQSAFYEIVEDEFPYKRDFYGQRIQMVGMSAKMSLAERGRILDAFDKSCANEVFVICSCRIIGEGIDTKNANQICFVDPKSSMVDIIQNVGRIARKVFGQDKPNSTILLPCWVDREKYKVCDGDREKCDEVIRSDLNRKGNFNAILNVLSALKQEDESLYDICMKYPNCFSPQELESNLERQGFETLEQVGEGGLIESLEFVLGNDDDDDDVLDMDYYEDCENEAEMLQTIAQYKGVNIEIHSSSLETPIERYEYEEDEDDNEDASNDSVERKTVRLMKIDKEDDEEEDIFVPIVSKDKKENNQTIKPPLRTGRFSLNIHSNPEVKVLWKISSELDLSKEFCSCVLDCEVLDEREARWMETLDKVKVFIEKEGTFPNQRSKKKDEKFMGLWICHQKINYKNQQGGMKDPKRRKIWEEFMNQYPNLFQSDDEKWMEIFNKVKVFIEKKRNLPCSTSKNKEEKSMGQWICSQKTHYKNQTQGMKDPKRKKFWEDFLNQYPDLFQSLDEKWMETLNQVKAFIEKEGRLPTGNSKNNDEKFMGQWIYTQNTKYKIQKEGMKDPRRRKIWEDFMNQYPGFFQSDDEKWMEIFNKVKVFIEKEGKFPSQRSKNKNEKCLGCWICAQKINYKNQQGGMKDPERRKIWEEFMNQYPDLFQSNDEKWMEIFNKVKVFIEREGKLPTGNSKNKDEKFIGRWIVEQKENYKNQTCGMKDTKRRMIWEDFMNQYPRFFQSDHEKWMETLNQVKVFIEKEGKLPTGNSKNKDEKILGKWIDHNKENYKNQTQGMKDPKRRKIWEEFMNQYSNLFQSDDEKWIETLNQVKVFIEKEGKLPSSNSKNKDEKIMGYWVETQKQNYKNQKDGMKDPKRKKNWEEFMNQYPNLFQSDDEKWMETLNKVKAFIEKEGKLPNSNSKNKDEKIMGSWIGDQKKNYKKQKYGMKDPKRRKIWEEIMTTHMSNKTKTEQEKETEEQEEKEEIISPKRRLKTTSLPAPSTTTKSEEEPSSSPKTKRPLSQISILHQKYITMNSANVHQLFHEQPHLWHEYHKINAQNDTTFSPEDVPRNRIIQQLEKIKTNRTKKVADLGCGLAQISHHFAKDSRFTFVNFDHVACSSNVSVVDIRNTGLPDHSVEIVILSLAMWGSNCHEYIKEAYRLLESGGLLYIAEPTKRWSQEDDETKQLVVGEEGNLLKQVLLEHQFRILDSNIDKFCMFVGVK